MVPTFRHPFGKSLAEFAARIALCEAAARPFGGRVRVSGIEGEQAGPSYTLHTVRALQARHPGIQWVILIGRDLVAERPRWHDWPALRAAAPFLIVGRAGVGDDVLLDDERDQLVPIALPDVSSTEVRRRLLTSAATDGLLDERVRAHIDAAGLYRGPA